MMTDSQTLTAAILGAAGLIAAAVKAASRQLTKTQDRGIAALIRSAESNATLAAKFDALTGRFEALTTRFNHFVEMLLANGIGVGLTTVARLGRAPTAPIPVILKDSNKSSKDDSKDD